MRFLALALIGINLGPNGYAITVEDPVPGQIYGLYMIGSVLQPCASGARPRFDAIEDRGWRLFCGDPPNYDFPPEHICPIAAHWVTVPGGWRVIIQCEAPLVS